MGREPSQSGIKRIASESAQCIHRCISFPSRMRHRMAQLGHRRRSSPILSSHSFFFPVFILHPACAVQIRYVCMYVNSREKNPCCGTRYIKSILIEKKVHRQKRPDYANTFNEPFLFATRYELLLAIFRDREHAISMSSLNA